MNLYAVILPNWPNLRLVRAEPAEPAENQQPRGLESPQLDAETCGKPAEQVRNPQNPQVPAEPADRTSSSFPHNPHNPQGSAVILRFPAKESGPQTNQKDQLEGSSGANGERENVT